MRRARACPWYVMPCPVVTSSARPRGLRVPKQLEARLAAIAGSRELGVMRAEVRGVEVGAVCGEQVGQAALHRRVRGPVVQAACDARLVRDRDHDPAGVVQLMNRLAGAGEEAHLARL